MSDEDYEILSDLPDSVEFICRLCSPPPSEPALSLPGWRIAINQFKTEAFDKVSLLLRMVGGVTYSVAMATKGILEGDLKNGTLLYGRKFLCL